MQTRLASLIESAMNIAIGLVTSWLTNIIVLPMFGFNVTGSDALSLTLIFASISFIRSYLVRRWFVQRTIKHYNHGV